MPHDDETTDTTDAAVEEAGANPFRIALNVTALIVVAALVIDNLDSVTIGFVFGEVEMPLAILIVLVWGLGVAGGWVGSRISARRRRK